MHNEHRTRSLSSSISATSPGVARRERPECADARHRNAELGLAEVGGTGGLETEMRSSYSGLEYRWGASLVERI